MSKISSLESLASLDGTFAAPGDRDEYRRADDCGKVREPRLEVMQLELNSKFDSVSTQALAIAVSPSCARRLVRVSLVSDAKNFRESHCPAVAVRWVEYKN